MNFPDQQYVVDEKNRPEIYTIQINSWIKSLTSQNFFSLFCSYTLFSPMKVDTSKRDFESLLRQTANVRFKSRNSQN